jgi:bifunctional DNase/RNase
MIFVILCVGLIVLFQSGYFVRSEGEPDLLEVDVEGLVVDPTTNSPVVILVGKEIKKALPIFIGAGEAGAIARGMNDIETTRPMTHDLIKGILDGLETRVERVVVTDLRDNIFFAQIVLSDGKEEKIIDSRPSDAIALAIRMGSPIFVSAEVMEKSASADLTGWVVQEGLIKNFGFRIQNVSKELLEAMGAESDDGVLVSHVENESSAEKGGLLRGDIILSLQGKVVSNVEEFDAVMVDVPRGEGIDMVVDRLGGGRKEVHLVPEPGEE